jgi:hypothetical protein
LIVKSKTNVNFMSLVYKSKLSDFIVGTKSRYRMANM